MQNLKSARRAAVKRRRGCIWALVVVVSERERETPLTSARCSCWQRTKIADAAAGALRATSSSAVSSSGGSEIVHDHHRWLSWMMIALDEEIQQASWLMIL